MSLIDLKSDLSKFRSKNPKPDNSGTTNAPKANSYGDKFSAYQPISNQLIKNIPTPNQPKDIDLTKKLDTTKLDDVIKDNFGGDLINSVSKLSPISIIKFVGKESELDKINSTFSKISKDIELNKIDKSNIIVDTVNNGEYNNESNINLKKDAKLSNEEILNQSVILNKDLVSPINNVIDPDIALDKKTMDIDWEAQSAIIDKKTSIKDILVNSNTNKLVNDSILNIDINPEKLETTSKIIDKKISQTVDTSKYDGQISELAIYDSRLDINKIIKTKPDGRHNTDSNSIFSNKLNQSLDFFDNTDANGFTKKTEYLKSEYKNNTSEFGYDTLVETNYFDIRKQYTTDGFTSFADLYDTKFISNSSIFDWDGYSENVPTVNYFTNTNTTAGFNSYTKLYDTKYVPESSQLDWNGNRLNSPIVNYFDIKKTNTSEGFHTFASLYDTKYVPESSQYDWDGNRLSSPYVNYFDLANPLKTTAGFHTFASLYDTKYVPESSQYDWDGVGFDAPVVNYFDLTNPFKTTDGFHKFAALYDTKYVPESSQFDWDGIRLNAPITDYFDIQKGNTIEGFHKFANLYDTKYIAESSKFDWDGNRVDAPTINYFDLNSPLKTTAGFHSFANLYDTKYVPESSQFDWDGKRIDARTVNYLDLTSPFKTTEGFHKFAGLYDTKYVPESSQFDWDGNRNDAKTINYFDLSTPFKTTEGFHKFAGLYDTKYVPESSQFDWDGNRVDAKTVNYLDLNSPFKTTTGFHSFASLYDTKYVPESSQFDWDGNRVDARTVNYLDLTSPFKTTEGFHKFASLGDSKYIEESSRFDWDGNRNDAKTVNYFDLNSPLKTTAGFHSFANLYDTKYVPESSQFDWDGGISNTPTVNYFDLNNKATSIGFHSFANKYDSKFVNDASEFQWKGIASDAPAVNYFDLNAQRTFRGFHTFSQEREPTAYKNDLAFILPEVTNFDWDGANPYGQTPTRFFGYTSTEKFGFLIKMSQFDGTAFPIITPKFNYDIAVGPGQQSNRNSLSSLRSQSEPLQTSDIEKYVPNTLGNKFVSGKKSTLENQIPVVNIQKFSFDITPYRKRGTSASFKRYTEGGGVNERPTYVDGNMELWANSDITSPQPIPQPGPVSGNLTAAQIIGLTKSAPVFVYNKDTAKTQIDLQYTKYDLVEQAYNTDPVYLQPFIDTSINGRDRDITRGLKIDENIKLRLNSSYDLKAFNLNIPDNVRSFVGSSFDYVRDAYNTFLPTLQSYRSFDEGLVRGGAVQHTIRTLLDAKRITKFLLSTKGVLWNLKQFGLQFMNPMQDTDTGFLGIPGALGLPGGAFGLNWTSIYNPLSIPANILGKSILINSKFTRHGILMYGEGAYEDIAVNRNDNTDGRTFDSFTRPSIFNRTSDYNRLVSLTKELLPNSYESIMLKREPQNQTFWQSVGSLAVDFRDNLFTILGIGGRWDGLPTADGRTTIRRLSTPFGGPNSFLGLFGTTINRATHPYKGTNTTGYFPTSDSILSGKDREVFYGGKDGDEVRYKDYKLSANASDEEGGESIHAQMWASSNKRTRTKNIYSDGVQRALVNRVGDQIFKFGYRSLADRLNENPTLRPALGMDSQNPIDETDISNFKTTDYSQLKRISNTKVSDFRKFITNTFDPTNDIQSTNLNSTGNQSFVTSADVIDIANNDIERRFGFGNPGAPKRRRDAPYVSKIKYSSLLSKENAASGSQLSNYQYAAYPIVKPLFNKLGLPTEKIIGVDRINIIDWKRSTQDLNSDYVYERANNSVQQLDKSLGGSEDLIQFYFSGVNLKASEFKPTEAIVFRAYLDTIVDNHKPSWSPIKYIGRADPVYAYDGYERDINFGFTVHIGSRDELKASWRKLNMLASWTAPEYIDPVDKRIQGEFGSPGTMKAPVIRLNIGNLYRKFPGFLSSLSYTFDNTQITWETAKLKEDQIITGPEGYLSSPGALELPKTISVQCTFVPFNIYRPEWDCVFYSLFDDYTGEGNVETGLVPMSDDRVNYFKTHDDLPISHRMNSGLCAILPKDLPPEPVIQTVEVKKPEPEVVKEKPIEKCGCKIYFNKDEDRYPIGYVSGDPYSVKGIDQIASWMINDCPNVKIIIEGHASREQKKPTPNNIEYNKLLSESRANTVKRLLMDAGVSDDRLEVIGYGHSKLKDTKNPGSVINRRIEITILNQDEANCSYKFNLNCSEQPAGCPTPTEQSRKDIGDGSEFWVVGPWHFTEGPFDSIPVGDDANDYDRSPVDNKWYKSVTDNWKVKWKDNAYKITSYTNRTRNQKTGIAVYHTPPSQ